MAGPVSAQRRELFEREVLALLPELRGAALRLARNAADAEDLVAESVACAWSRLEQLRDPASFRGWIFRILANTFISQRRRQSARPVHEPLPDEADEAGFSLFDRLHQPFLLWRANPEREFLDRLLREELEEAVDALPEAFRLVVVLVDVQGFRYAEAAEALDIPVGTVRSRLARARARLQRALWRHGVDAGLARADPDPTQEQRHERAYHSL